MEFIYSDGGRSKYFKAKDVGDCVVRAICNASGKDYKEVYDALRDLSKRQRVARHRKSPRNGVCKQVYRKYIEGILGWEWVSCSGIGKGISVHLNEDEMPFEGTYIVRVSHRLTCVRDGALVDTYDCSRFGERGVYGYWVKRK